MLAVSEDKVRLSPGRGLPLAAHTQVPRRESRRHMAQHWWSSKAIIHQKPACGCGVFTLSLLHAICFPTLKISMGQACLGRKKKGSCGYGNLTTDPALMLTVRAQDWQAGPPNGENSTLNIPAVGLLEPSHTTDGTLERNHLRKAPLILDRWGEG